MAFPDGPLVERLGGQLGAVPEGPALGGEPLEEVGAEEGRGAVGQGRVCLLYTSDAADE